MPMLLGLAMAVGGRCTPCKSRGRSEMPDSGVRIRWITMMLNELAWNTDSFGGR